MRVDEAETVELDRLEPPEPPEPDSGGGLVRGLAGSLAAGLVLLTLGLLAAELLTSGGSGPGVGVLVGHAVAAVLAVVAAVVADRTRGFATAAAVTAVLLVTAVTLWVYWLA